MLITCALCFLILAKWTNKRVCYTLSLVATLLWVNAHVFSVNNDALYLIRGFIIFFAATYLLKKPEKQNIYQSLILFVTLISYTLHEAEYALNKVIIYDHFGAIIYGLIACHFIGIFKTLWPTGCNVGAGNRAGCKNIQGVN